MITETLRALNNRPTYLFYTVTSRCNAFCEFCWNWKNVLDAGKFAKPGQPIKRPELSIDEIDKFTKNLPAMLAVNLYGGEPFLRDDLLQIISLFIENSRAKYISIPTNGSWPERIESVIGPAVAKYPDTFFKLYLSIDGPGIEHDKIRKIRDGYKKLLQSRDYLFSLKKKHANLSVSANLNFNSQSQHYMESFLEEVMNWSEFDSIGLDLVRGEDIFDKGLLKTDQALFDKLQARVAEYRPVSGQPFSPLHKAIEQRSMEIVQLSLKNPERRVFDCFAGKKIVLMDDIGQVFACEHLLDRVMGNIRDFDYNLDRLLASEIAKRYRQDIIDKKCNCRWDCAMNNSSISDIKNYPDLMLKAAKNSIKAITQKKG